MRAVWCGFAAGVIVLQQQAALPAPRGAFALLLAGVAALAAACWGMRGQGWRARGGVCALCVAAGCAGFGYAAWRAHLRIAISLPVQWEGRDIALRGAIHGLPARDDKSARFLFDVDPASAPFAPFPRTIELAWFARNGEALPPLAPGSRWQLTVRLKRPHGNANDGVRDTEATLFARNIRATGYVSESARARRLAGDARGVAIAIDRWRAALRTRIATVLAGEPHQGVVAALAVGAQGDISAADWALMRATGTSHLVAISGLHIGLVAGLGGWLAGALWRRSAFVGRGWPLLLPAQAVAAGAGVLCAALYAALAGFNVPAQRALGMAGVVALAFLGGRKVARSLVLAWALGLVLLLDPWAVLGVSFWLSFGAVAAILFAMSARPRVPAQRDAAPHEETAARSRRAALHAALCTRVARWLAAMREGIRLQWAVTIALAPLTVYAFGQIPLLGALANLFAIPWVSMLVTPAVLAGVVLPAPLDAYAFHAAHGLLNVLVAGLQPLAAPAWALWRLPRPEGWALGAAAAGVAWCLAPRGWPLRWAAPLAWLPLLWPAPSAPPPGAFRLTALDIGQGSSVLVETAHHTLLFDAGPGPESTHAGERIVVPYLQAHGIATLDSLVISHDDSDHAGGAPAVLDGVRVRQFVAGLLPSNRLWARARAAGAGIVRCAAGQRWQWDDVEFTMLWPDPGPLHGPTNAHCCVLRVRTLPAPDAPPGASAGVAAALLAADIEAPQERVLVARAAGGDAAVGTAVGTAWGTLSAQILVVPHHGSKTSSIEPFLDSIGPLIAVFQVGYRNRFHHPAPSVFARYRARHIALARNDADGAVQIVATRGTAGHAAVLTLERYRSTHHRYWMD
jgi:competence protein ComEC